MSDIQAHRLRYYFAELDRPRLCLWTQVLPYVLTMVTFTAFIAMAVGIWEVCK